MSIYWRDDFATGNDEIDQHHKELFQKIDALVAACKEGREKSEVLELVGFLHRYVQNHFAAEEQFMTQHNSPNTQEHRRQHEKFRNELKQLATECSREGATLGVVTNSLKLTYLWLRDHIQQMDRVLVSAQAGCKSC